MRSEEEKESTGKEKRRKFEKGVCLCVWRGRVVGVWGTAGIIIKYYKPTRIAFPCLFVESLIIIIFCVFLFVCYQAHHKRANTPAKKTGGTCKQTVYVHVNFIQVKVKVIT